MRKYLALGAAFEGGRTFAGATSAAYLVSLGLPLSSVAQLKIVQAIVVFFGEVPTGLIADYFGRRFSLICAALSGLIAFSFYAVGKSLLPFAIAEVFLGLALCFWSGAYEAYAIDSLELDRDAAGINKFFHLNGSVVSFAVIASGFIGGLVALKGLGHPFFLNAAAMLLLVAVLVFSFPRDGAQAKEVHSKEAFFTVSKSVLSPELLPYVGLTIVLMCMMQPVVYYWQPWFQELGETSTGLKLGSVFVAFQSTIFITSLIYAAYSKSRFATSVMALAGMLTAFGLAVFLTVSSDRILSSAAIFCLAEAFLTIVMSLSKAQMNQQIDSRLRASILSSISFLGKIGSIVALGLIGFYLDRAPTQTEGLKRAFMASGSIGIVIGVAVLARLAWKRRFTTRELLAPATLGLSKN